MELGTRHGILRAAVCFNHFRQVGVRAGMPLSSLPPEPWFALHCCTCSLWALEALLIPSTQETGQECSSLARTLHFDHALHTNKCRCPLVQALLSCTASLTPQGWGPRS